ncbi:hypothetical protein [Nostoc favosum]|uniref:Glucose-inhibited division protein A n=1 Tax=Nostoc favosum CHAB5714 TaxID=2780399 RepID=A0ABS8I857_9NOSO|nr:hypothetical protein [Nostoc favosum]MCC5599989.1 glucose-inhibited division protein A [Nostoc favosum CHAB5714]
MNRSKIIAILTGAISVILAIAYLILVQLLDYRDMKPAPINQFDEAPALAIAQPSEGKLTIRVASRREGIAIYH